MALSYVTYAATGGTNYSVTFPYVAQADISVYVDGVLQTEGAGNDYTWFSATVIQFTAGSTPTVGQTIVIRRTTEETFRLVDFQDAGNLTEYDLDLSANQLFYLVQEGLDNTNDLSMQLDTDNKWNAETHVIKNLGDPVNPQDAVTKNYLDVTWTAYMDASVAAAAASEAAAAASETAAAASETAAAASYDSFDDRYLGAKASDPALDNDGDPLLTGALYWNTTSSIMRVYNGSAWETSYHSYPSVAGHDTHFLQVQTGAEQWFNLFGTANTWTSVQTVQANGGSFIKAKAYDVAHDSAFNGHLTEAFDGTARGFFGSIPADPSSYISAYTWDDTLGTPAWNRVFGADRDALDIQLTSEGMDSTGTLRAKGYTAPVSGAGLELGYTGGVGYITSYDRTGASWQPTAVRGSEVQFHTASGEMGSLWSDAGVSVLEVTGVSGKAARLVSNSASGGNSNLHLKENDMMKGILYHDAVSHWLALTKYKDSDGTTVMAQIYLNDDGSINLSHYTGKQVAIPSGLAFTSTSATIRMNDASSVLVFTGGSSWTSGNGYISMYGPSHATQAGNLLMVPGTGGQFALYNGGAAAQVLITNSSGFNIPTGYTYKSENQATYAGVLTSAGGWQRQPTGVSWTPSKIAVGQYRVTHNLGNAYAYVVVANPNTGSGVAYHAQVYQQINYFDIFIRDAAGTNQDSFASFIVRMC